MKRIVAPVDFASATPSVIDFAAHLASVLGAGLEIVAIHHLIEAPAFGEMNLLETEAIETRLDRLVEQITLDVPIAQKVISVSTKATTADGILAAAQGAALLVVGQTESRGVWKWMQGDTTAQLLEHATCPVLVVPAGASWARPEVITLALDARPLHDRAAASLRELAVALATEVDVFLDASPDKVPAQKAALNEVLTDVAHHYSTSSANGHARLANYLSSRCEAVDGVWLCLRHARRQGWRRSRVDDLGVQMAHVSPVPTLVLVDPPEAERRLSPGLVVAQRGGFADGLRSGLRV